LSTGYPQGFQVSKHKKMEGKMSSVVVRLAVALALVSLPAAAGFFTVNTDPFTGSTAPATPGRQVVGGEPDIVFNVATDVFLINPDKFGITDPVLFLSDFAANVPTGGVNVIVLQDTPNPFAAGIAATQIAGQITTPGPGFFIYFNSGLDLPRLVFSADLDDPTADLKVIARMGNFKGNPGVLPTFTAANFAFAPVPETSSMMLMGGGLAVIGAIARRRRR